MNCVDLAWRLRREILNIDFPKNPEVAEYLKTSVNAFMKVIERNHISYLE